MKKSFIVFSLIGLVALGISLSSCDSEATSVEQDYNCEERWQKLQQQVEQLNAEYEHLTSEKVFADGKKMVVGDGEIDLRCKYKGVKSGKLMYKMLQRVFSKKFRNTVQGLSDEQVRGKIVAEMESMTGVIDEQLKAQIVKTKIDDTQTACLHNQYASIQAHFMKLSMDLGVDDLRHYTEEYIDIINTTLKDSEERMILTMQMSIMYYIHAFWSIEGKKLL